jgi:hypothetical protein
MSPQLVMVPEITNHVQQLISDLPKISGLGAWGTLTIHGSALITSQWIHRLILRCGSHSLFWDFWERGKRPVPLQQVSHIFSPHDPGRPNENILLRQHVPSRVSVSVFTAVTNNIKQAQRMNWACATAISATKSFFHHSDVTRKWITYPCAVITIPESGWKGWSPRTKETWTPVWSISACVPLAGSTWNWAQCVRSFWNLFLLTKCPNRTQNLSISLPMQDLLPC